jgi:hypothetical protein
MAVGMCRHCGYSPVADDAPLCVKCGGRYPHPDAASSSLQMVLFFLLGVVLVAAASAGVAYFIMHRP